MKLEKVIIYTDGTAMPNPGRAGYGAVITDEEGRKVATLSEAIGHGTNNQAEYRGIIAALTKALSLGVKRVDLRSDSELVVRQINGRYRVKNTLLRPLYQQVGQLLSRLEGYSVTHVPRELNREADRLAEQALR